MNIINFRIFALCFGVPPPFWNPGSAPGNLDRIDFLVYTHKTTRFCPNERLGKRSVLGWWDFLEEDCIPFVVKVLQFDTYNCLLRLWYIKLFFFNINTELGMHHEHALLPRTLVAKLRLCALNEHAAHRQRRAAPFLCERGQALLHRRSNGFLIGGAELKLIKIKLIKTK